MRLTGPPVQRGHVHEHAVVKGLGVGECSLVFGLGVILQLQALADFGGAGAVGGVALGAVEVPVFLGGGGTEGADEGEAGDGEEGGNQEFHR